MTGILYESNSACFVSNVNTFALLYSHVDTVMMRSLRKFITDMTTKCVSNSSAVCILTGYKIDYK